MVTRRSCLAFGSAWLLSGRAGAQERGDSAGPATRQAAAAAATPLPPIPVVFRVAIEPLPTSFVDEQLATAVALFGGHRVTFEEGPNRKPIATTLGEVESRDDRDAFVKLIEPNVVNVFIVRSLRDVDDPSRLRMGVTWRNLRDLSKKYVVVAAYSPPPVLAHELGHFLGLGHSGVKNNLMSYEREEGKPIFLDPAQGTTVRATARALFAGGTLAAPARLWKKSPAPKE